jgi:murein DD-endopeptidase MepM/ murein hydrolase activator NlpD
VSESKAKSNDGEELSHDPRTWLGGAGGPASAAESPAAAPDSLGFDPKTWVKGKPAPSAPPARPGPVAESGARSGPDRRVWLIGAGAAALAGAGLGKLILTGKASGPASERQIMTLALASALPGALASYGFNQEESIAIGRAASGALPPDAANLRLEVQMRRRNEAAELVALTLTAPDGSGVQVTPGTGSAFVARRLAAKLVTQVKVVQGQMDSQSFYSSAVAAGLKDALIPDFFQAFVYDFDFQREIFPGDVFEAAFQQHVNDRGEAVGDLDLLYASMVTKAKSRALYRFRPSGATEAAWFDGAGKSIRRSLMRTPVEGARISSTFGMRDHPVLGFTRAHKGTDFATPVGTPVFASGAGRVTFVGPRGDFGNFVTIQHTPMLETAYAHLSKFADGLKAGSEVGQGQQIALSGNTGLTSGPHLHYEVRVDGQQVDSQTFQTEEGVALAGADLAAFVRQRDRIDVQRTRTT